jgi:formate dehydrogenase maturation protein FdhE
MKFTFDIAVRRADAIAPMATGARELLDFYRGILKVQRDIFASLSSESLVGDPVKDVSRLRPGLRQVLELTCSTGSEYLVETAGALLESGTRDLDEMVVDYWQNPSDIQFFAKALIQPYASLIAVRGKRLPGTIVDERENRCPFCSGKPQLCYLEGQEQEGSTRKMQCAVCLSSWTFRRVVCANCLEEDPGKLGYFSTPDLEHVRVETCDTCKYYIKGIDLSVTGLAVPIVDEVAAAPLDIWAREQGYTKIELNLVGV